VFQTSDDRESLRIRVFTDDPSAAGDCGAD
jgi:hypothetical protein